MLQGFVTERDLLLAEESFPGIRRFYAELVEKPRTFLELMWRFACRCERAGTPASPVAMASSGVIRGR